MGNDFTERHASSSHYFLAYSTKHQSNINVFFEERIICAEMMTEILQIYFHCVLSKCFLISKVIFIKFFPSIYSKHSANIFLLLLQNEPIHEITNVCLHVQVINLNFKLRDDSLQKNVVRDLNFENKFSGMILG